MVIFVLPTLNSRSTTPFDRQIIVSCTLQAWRWTRILITHSVVLDPLLRTMWHVAPESTSQQVLGSPIPTLPTNSCSVTGLSVLDVPVAPIGPPASDPVFTANDLTTIAVWFPPSCSTSGSRLSASQGSSPSSTFLLSLDLCHGKFSLGTSIRRCLSDLFTVYFRQASLYCSASGRLIKLNSLCSNLKSSKPFAS